MSKQKNGTNCLSCNDTGLMDFGERASICDCQKGKDIASQVKNGKLCPACQNSGITGIDDGDIENGVPAVKIFCSCCHGRKLRRAESRKINKE